MPSPLPARADVALDEGFLRKLESLALVARKLNFGRERGERKSQQAGRGIAFSAHRAYAPGDDFRFLDWKVYARSDRLLVKQYEEQLDLSVHLLLDCSGSMAHEDGAKFRYAKQLTAALGYIALANLDRVSVQPYAAEPKPRLAPQRGRSRALVLLRYLAPLTAAGGTDLKRAAQAVRAREARGGLAAVISDGFDRDGLLAGVDLLRYGRLQPFVLIVGDPRDREAKFSGELSLVDRESGEERTLLVTPGLLARYRAAYRAHFDELSRALRERHVPIFELSVETPLERAVLDVLRRGGAVG